MSDEKESPEELRERLKRESIDQIKEYLAEDDDRPEDDEGVRYGYMCSVDFDHELGHAFPDTRIYPSVVTLQKQRKCCSEDGACGIYRVKVVKDKIIRGYDFKRERDKGL